MESKDQALIKKLLKIGHSTPHYEKDCVVFRLQNGTIHRDDGPAITWADGSCTWYKQGKIHRNGEPAILLSSGTKEWCQNGNKHRLDGPAVEYFDGKKEYWVNGLYVPSEYFYKDYMKKGILFTMGMVLRDFAISNLRFWK
jgi:hypothetical protein